MRSTASVHRSRPAASRPLLSVVIAMALCGAAWAADFIGLPSASLRDLLLWSRRAPVPVEAWAGIDRAYDDYRARLDEIDRERENIFTVSARPVTDKASCAERERELLRRLDLLLVEEDRLASELRAAVAGCSDPEIADEAIEQWRTRRLLGLANAVPASTTSIYLNARTPMIEIDGLGLSAQEEEFVAAALRPHRMELVEKAKMHLRERCRFLAVLQWPAVAESEERTAAVESAVAGGRKARMALMKAHQNARRAVVDALPVGRREEVARALLAQAAPGVRYTRVGAIAETLVPYLHDLDDRTQRKLEAKIRQLRRELEVAEKRLEQEFEQAIAAADFERMTAAGDGFESALDTLAEREGRGMVTLIGQRVLEPMVALEMEYAEGEEARAMLATIMPANRVDDFLRDLGARAPERLRTFQGRPGEVEFHVGDLLTQASLPSVALQVRLEAAARGNPRLRAGLREAMSAHARAWRERVEPAQRRFREVLGADPSGGRPRLGPTLVFEGGVITVRNNLDLEAANRAAAALDQAVAEVQGALLASLEALLASEAPDAVVEFRHARAWEIYAARSDVPLSAEAGPTVAEPIECAGVLFEAGVPDGERVAALLVASGAMANYEQSLRERLGRLTRGGLLRSKLDEERWRSGRFLSSNADDTPPEEARTAAQVEALRAEAKAGWRAALVPVFEAWGQVLSPEDLQAARQVAMIRAYPHLASHLRPLEGFMESTMAMLQSMPREDPRRVAAEEVLVIGLEGGRRRLLDLTTALERASTPASGMVGESSTAPAAPQAALPAAVRAWIRDLDDHTVRVVRDVWLVLGDAAVLETPDAWRVLRPRQ